MSLVLGLAAVSVFDGSSQTTGQTTGRYVVDLVLGVGALAFAAGMANGRVGNRAPSSAGPRPVLDGRLSEMLRTPPTPVAALVPVTLRPQGTREVVEAVRSFGIRHERVLVTGLLLVVDLYLAVKGLLGVLG